MSNPTSDEQYLNKAIFYMLKLVFVEIRASESINRANKFADIFHSVPMLLSQRTSIDDDIKIYNHIHQKAQKYQMENYIEKLKELALKSSK